MRRTTLTVLTGAAVAAVTLVPTGSIGAAGTVVYDSTADPLPGNVPSLGYQATSTDELGDHVALSAGPATLGTATLTMSSWACETGGWSTANCATTPGATFQHPVTITLYEVDSSSGSPQPGAAIGSVTQDVTVPYRPSADPDCAGGGWQDAAGACFNGVAFDVDVDLASLAVPGEFIYGIAFDTNTHGANPIGAPGPYESLNVGLTLTAPSVGTNVDPDVLFWDTAPVFGGDDTFRAAGGWDGYTPMIRFTTVPPQPTVETCRNGGYAELGFKNQGLCIASVVAKGKPGA